MANREIATRTAAAEGTWYDSLPRSTRIPTVSGILIMAVTFMGFGVWGNMAPIAGASPVTITVRTPKPCNSVTSQSARSESSNIG